jgi:hypothetical protein
MADKILIAGAVDPLRAQRVTRQLRDKQIEKPEAGDDKIDSGMLSRAAMTTQSLDQTTKIVTGVVVDTLGSMHFYKVQAEPPIGIIGCAALSEASNTFTGARSLSSIVPGSHVWIMVHPQLEYGTIIGCAPPFAIDAREKRGDAITLSSRCGPKVDDAHNFPTTMAGGSGVIDFSADRPVDGTSAGEWGYITETGLRIFLDPFMLQMAVNESCGVFAFMYDNMLRLAGNNLQIRTAGSELEALNDQGEFTHIHGFTPYPWEHKGVFGHATTPSKDNTAEQSQIDTPYYAEREPVHDDQMPFHRVTHVQGYLGQGGQRRVQLPYGKTGEYRYSTDPDKLGPLVFSEDILLTGRYNLRSAKAITIAKHVPMANFKRMARPETVSDVDKGADSETNYRFAGVEDWANNVSSSQQIPAHEIRDELKESTEWAQKVQFDQSDSGAPVFLIRAASVMDSHAFTFNMESNQAYLYHKHDWGTADEAGSPLKEGDKASFQSKMDFSSLAKKQYLEPPKAIEPETIDHRYDDNPEGVGGYYPNTSSIDLLEDGGIVIADGFGAELRMTGGQIFLSAPGDIWLKSGRNTNVWAGQDAIIKAKNSIDVTASDKDVRIKAEKNMQLLAGNSGKGGLLMESRGVEKYDFAPKLGEDVVSGGVMIKSSKAPAVVIGPSVYVRAGLDESSLGDITMDCNQGKGAYKTNAGYHEHFVRDAVFWWFCEGTGKTVGQIYSAYEFRPTACTIGASCNINGNAMINGYKISKSGDFVLDGGYGSPSGGMVGKMKAADVTKQKEGLQAVTEDRQAELATKGMSEYSERFTTKLYETKKPGDNETIKKIGVSLRDDKQYLTEEFVLFEDRWQQMSRISGGGSTGKWKENAVKANAEEEEDGLVTYPYPGKKSWKEDKNLVQPDLGFVEASGSGDLTTVEVMRDDPMSGKKTGMPYRGDDADKEPWSFMPNKSKNNLKLDGNYRVIVQ